MRRRIVLLATLLPFAQAAAGPADDDRAGRRAIRGEMVERAPDNQELRRLQRFEEESFPRPVTRQARDESVPAAAEEIAAPRPSAWAPPEPLVSPRRPEAPPPAMPPSAVPWLAGLRLPDLPVRFDPHVVRYLEFYRDDPRGRAIMSAWLKRQGRYRALIEAGLAKAGLPRALLYVVMVESGYEPLDRSPAGAAGLWQLMPDGARIYGLRQDFWMDERRDPVASTEAAIRYFGDLQARFGSWHLALAAYNAGYGAVLRAMAKYNTNDFWELGRHENGLPWETLLYVPKVLAAAVVGENRAAFGLAEVVADPPFAYETAEVTTSMSLQGVARASGTTLEEIARLNPALRRGRTPPEPWTIRLPPGTRARFVAAADRYREALRPHCLRYGERLDDLARETGATSRELRRINGIVDTAELKRGMALLVPSGRPPLPLAADEELIVVAVPDSRITVPNRKRIYYRPLPSDTVADIASFFRVAPTDLRRWNNIDGDAKFSPRMVLQLWVAREFDVSQASLLDPSRVHLVTTGSPEFLDLLEARKGRKRVVHKVRSGETFKRIAARYRLTEGDLERINQLSRKTRLAVGQRLTVYVAMSAKEKVEAEKRWRALVEAARKAAREESAPTTAAVPSIDKEGTSADDDDTDTDEADSDDDEPGAASASRASPASPSPAKRK